MYQGFVKTALVATMAVVMVGCGGKIIEKDPRKPAKLVKLEAPVAVLSPVSSTKLEQGTSTFKRNKAKAKDVVDLQVAPTAEGFIAASRGGVVSAISHGQTAWSSNVNDAITSGVAVSNDTVVVGTRQGKIVALDVASGQTRWTAQLPSASLAPALISGGKVIVSTNSSVIYGLNLATGAIDWQYTTQAPTVSIRGMAKPILVDAKTALVGASDGRIHAIDIATGSPAWVRRVGLATGSGDIAKLRDVDGAPIVAGNHLYATAYSGQVVGYDMATGRTMFVSELASTNTLTVLGSALIGTNVDGEIVAFNRLSGEELWKNSELKFRGLTNPVAIGQHIAVGDKDGVVHILDNTGKIISRVDAKNELTSLQAVGNRLYAQSANGVVSVWQF